MTEDGERLRRRLYRPGADHDDVDAYLADRDPEPAPEPVAAGALARRGRRWPVVVAVAAIRIAGFAASTAVVRTPWALIGVYGIPIGVIVACL